MLLSRTKAYYLSSIDRGIFQENVEGCWNFFSSLYYDETTSAASSKELQIAVRYLSSSKK